MSKQSSKRPWRKLVKKLQRKRKRQKLASQNDKELEEAELEKLKDPLYKSWQEQQVTIERQRQLEEEKVRQEQEELWLRRELLAQQQFKREELKRKDEEAKLEAERRKREEELRHQKQIREKKREEIKLQSEKANKEFENIMTSMRKYLEDITMKTPTRLEIIVESRPGEKSCEFFEKTNCCRFDPGCTFNHKRPLLAKIILIKHFFQHPLLQQQEHVEYSNSDSDLELSDHDLRDAYDEFCEDVWPVLEEFGSIINFRTVRNVHAHLRGHVFVEYVEKRSALKAFINLQNRYYASNRLNVEFSNLQQWHKGVCGLSLSRKCPKGDKCNFLHLMKNINNKYNQPIHNPERSSRRVPQTVQETPITSWDCEDNVKSSVLHSRMWRWSESPEIELKIKTGNDNLETKINSEKAAPYSTHRKSSYRESRSDRQKSHSMNKSKTSSHSRNTEYDTDSYKRRTKSPDKSKKKSSDSKHSKRKKSKDRLDEKSSTSSSQRRESRHRVASPDLRSRKMLKRKSKSKSPSTRKKHKKSDQIRHNKSPH